MKLLATAIFAGMLAFGTVACAKEEPKKATTVAVAATAAPAEVKKDEAPKTKRVCVDVKDKQGQPVKNKDGSIKQNCRDVKQHKKHEGTKVPDKK
jgi:hypothetical protein